MNDQDSLDKDKTDQIVTITKGTLSLIPYVGPIITEIIVELIPNQRLDRIAYLCKELNKRVADLEESCLKKRMETPEFIDLFEDGATQSAKALSDERRDKIATLLANSLSEDQFDHMKTKLMLNLLGELNEAELIILKYYSLRMSPDEQRAFGELHPKVFGIYALVMGSSQEEVDQYAIQSSFKEHLVRIDLLRRRFQKYNVKKGELPEFDEHTGSIKAKGYEITSLGRLMIRMIE